ncbi:MAG: hypothetical protein JO316_22010 [Abitibacteriaceae bacterium]|nr:hypothetical protein [Abditibacteriaceae bacterium]MBV9868041.1 hypothetical protein [Abditibacteriaceae bacterium]
MQKYRSLKWQHLIAVAVCVLPTAVLVPGCGGGGSGSGLINNPSPSFPYAGHYTGTFTGQGIHGSFDANVDQNGKLTGTAQQQELPGVTFPATGTIDRNGKVTATVTANAPVGPGGTSSTLVSTLTGNAVTNNGITTLSGTFVSKATTGPFKGQTIGSGTFTGNNNPNGSPTPAATVTPRPTTQPTVTPTPAFLYAGHYTGTFTGSNGQNIHGSFDVTVDANGKLTGTAQQQEFPGMSFPATGSIDRAGKITVNVTGTLPTTPPATFTSRLSGTSVARNGAVTVSGTFTTTLQDGTANGSGTFQGAKV